MNTMKQGIFFGGRLLALALVLAVFAACSSTPKVDRVSSDTVTDLSGRWNDSDVRLVCETLISDCLSSPRVAQFIRDYGAKNNGKLPACVVGSFQNASSEHIDTSIISKTMEAAIVNSGKLDFVAGGDTRAELRAERQDQQVNASPDTASALGYETGAALILTGSVKSMVDQAGNKTSRSYFVNAELTSVETNVRLWMGENSDIKKVVTRPGYKL